MLSVRSNQRIPEEGVVLGVGSREEDGPRGGGVPDLRVLGDQLAGEKGRPGEGGGD